MGVVEGNRIEGCRNAINVCGGVNSTETYSKIISGNIARGCSNFVKLWPYDSREPIKNLLIQNNNAVGLRSAVSSEILTTATQSIENVVVQNNYFEGTYCSFTSESELIPNTDNAYPCFAVYLPSRSTMNVSFRKNVFKDFAAGLIFTNMWGTMTDKHPAVEFSENSCINCVNSEIAVYSAYYTLFHCGMNTSLNVHDNVIELSTTDRGSVIYLCQCHGSGIDSLRIINNTFKGLNPVGIRTGDINLDKIETDCDNFDFNKQTNAYTITEIPRHLRVGDVVVDMDNVAVVANGSYGDFGTPISALAKFLANGYVYFEMLNALDYFRSGDIIHTTSATSGFNNKDLSVVLVTSNVVYVKKLSQTEFANSISINVSVKEAVLANREGATVSRPSLTVADAGFQYFDTTIGQSLVWDGTSWIPATDNRPATLTSMGYKILDKDKTFKSQVEGSANQNTIFEIRDQFDLDGTTALIPANCELKFVGGAIVNGVLGFGEGCRITSLYSGILSGIRFSNTGAQLCSDFRLSWYNFDNTCTRDNFLFLYTLYPMFSTSDYNVVWDIPEVHVLYSNPIVLGYGKCHDFNNTIIHAQATENKKYLFKIERPLPTASEYTKIADAVQDSAFSNTTGMLIVKDSTKLYRRPNHQQDYYRADVLLVQDNDLVNQPIMDYDSDADTSASIFLLSADEAGTEFKNVVFDRSTSEYIASLVSFSACYCPAVKNVVVKTAPLEAYGEEGVLKFEYSFSPLIKDCSLIGNYGSTLGTGQFSYNICLYNCSNVLLERINSNATWHSFGCRGVNGIVVKDSIIDQFDSHTYGKDFAFYDCIFHNKHTGNPFVGYAKFVNCTFNEVQVATELDSEIASFPYKRIYENCTFTDCGNLIHVSKINAVDNLRSMLQASEYPCLIVKNCKMIYKNASPASIYYVNSNVFDALSNAQPAVIEIKNLEIVGTFQSSTNINVVSSASINADIIAENVYSLSSTSQNLKMPTSLLAGSKLSFHNVRIGTFEQGATRPSIGNRNIGYVFFDTTLGKPVYWQGTKWVDATGADLT